LTSCSHASSPYHAVAMTISASFIKNQIKLHLLHPSSMFQLSPSSS
jgi:hypothetical protein